MIELAIGITIGYILGKIRMAVDIKVLYDEIASDEGKVFMHISAQKVATIGIGHKILNTDPEVSLPIRDAYDSAHEDNYRT